MHYVPYNNGYYPATQAQQSSPGSSQAAAAQQQQQQQQQQQASPQQAPQASQAQAGRPSAAHPGQPYPPQQAYQQAYQPVYGQQQPSSQAPSSYHPVQPYYAGYPATVPPPNGASTSAAGAAPADPQAYPHYMLSHYGQPIYFDYSKYPPVPILVKPKRKQVKNACVNCQKACKKCDDGRPCQRCIKYGLTDTCQNSVRKERKKGIKRGPYKRRNQDGSTPGTPTGTSGATSSAASSAATTPAPSTSSTSANGSLRNVSANPFENASYPTYESFSTASPASYTPYHYLPSSSAAASNSTAAPAAAAAATGGPASPYSTHKVKTETFAAPMSSHSPVHSAPSTPPAATSGHVTAVLPGMPTAPPAQPATPPAAHAAAAILSGIPAAAAASSAAPQGSTASPLASQTSTPTMAHLTPTNTTGASTPQAMSTPSPQKEHQ
ncbi:hypothetical protein BC940DRAFT_309353 [Gongronella butleri]|nr:hypothetical protein BC940DRAFT_309353 [Gongronella butleri]